MTRTAKSPSSYHTAHATATPPPLTFLDLGAELDDDDVLGTAPLPDGLDRECRLVQSPNPKGRPSDRLMSQNEKASLVALSDIIMWTETFIASLRSLDQCSSSRSLSSGEIVGLEAALDVHLNRLTESERVREDQCQELQVLAQELATIQWEEVELDLIMGNGLGLGMFDETRPHEAESEIGWADALNERTAGLSRRPSGEEDDPDQSIVLPEPDVSLTSSHTPLPFPPLRLATHDVLAATNTLLGTLSALSEHLVSTSSLSTTIWRQLRGLRAGVDSCREREAYEATCRRKIEDWEEKRVRDGLVGLGMKDVLEREVSAFEGVLEDCGLRMMRMREMGRGS